MGLRGREAAVYIGEVHTSVGDVADGTPQDPARSYVSPAQSHKRKGTRYALEVEADAVAVVEAIRNDTYGAS